MFPATFSKYRLADNEKKYRNAYNIYMGIAEENWDPYPYSSSTASVLNFEASLVGEGETRETDSAI